MIPLLKPACSDREIELVTQVLRSGWWGQGPMCERFEDLLSQRYAGRFCVTMNSATSALHLALLDLGVGPGDEVILPALTFVSTGLAVLYCGATPVFADVRSDTLTVDWDDLLDKVTSTTKAIIPVDYAGFPANDSLDAGSWFGLSNPPAIVQDAAHAAGGLAYGDRTCLSFHPVKNLASGDGGAVLTSDPASDANLRALRWCGINRSTWLRTQGTQERYGWDYDIAQVGHKAHWNDVQAAIGLAQLERLDVLNARRRAIAMRYNAALARHVKIPIDHPSHTWHLYVIDVDERDRIIDGLLNAGISAGVHYKPLTHYPMFAGNGNVPVTEAVWSRLVSLPIFYDLSDNQVDYVCERLLDLL